MEPLIGHWMWDAEARTMHRRGASVRHVGPDPDRPRTGHSLWLRFELALGNDRVELPVEQRLAGRDSNFRGLWYRVDFREAAPAYPLWSAAERLIADALACWRRGELADGLPTGIGIQGGWLNGSFREELYRLYLPTYVGSPKKAGVALPPPPERRWTFSPARPGAEDVDLRAVAGRGFDAFMQAARKAADAYPSLIASDRAVVLTPGEHDMVQLLYADAAFGTARFACTGAYRGQEWLWSIYESSIGVPDVVPPAAERTDLRSTLDRFFTPNRPPRGKEKPPALTPDQQDRAYSAFHDALFAVPEGSIKSERLRAPPLVVKSRAPWQRAGYMNLDCLTATSVATEELKAAFLDPPEPAQLLASPVGPAFDARAGALYAPDGSSLAFESAGDWLGLAPTQLNLRCRSAGLDWPVLVRRRDHRPPGTWDYRPQLLSRWVISHEECLQAWRQEGHSGLPDAEAWDCMRQFIEEAILSWGDGPAAGPAPQSLATSGGWYEGRWRRQEFQRLLARPVWTDQIARTDAWSPYAPAPTWRRTDSTSPDYADAPTSGYAQPRTPPAPFEKVSESGPPARLFASGYIVRHQREEETRSDLVDYQDEHDRVRLGGTRSRMSAAAIVRVTGAASPVAPGEPIRWPAKEEVELPDLLLWRRLRDAGEGGLRDGETASLHGGYFFDRLYATSLRITALSAEIEDFDYRMFGYGNAFAV